MILKKAHSNNREIIITINYWFLILFGYCNLEFIWNLVLVICYLLKIWCLQFIVSGLSGLGCDGN